VYSSFKLQPRRQPFVTHAQILAWVDAHHARTSSWPSRDAGPIMAAVGETWAAVNSALRRGLRGLPGGDSLYQLLRRERGVKERRGRPSQLGRSLLANSLRASGHSLADIGRHLGVSRQRVFQLVRWRRTASMVQR